MKAVLGACLGLAGMILLLLLWHKIGLAQPVRHQDYRYTEYLQGCIGAPFCFLYLVLACILGFAVKRHWPAAVGMVLPLPMAASMEMSLDPTSHNLIPFEILLYWVPAFLLAFGAAYLGAWMRRP